MEETKNIIIRQVEEYRGHENVGKFVEAMINTLKNIDSRSLASGSGVIVSEKGIAIKLVHTSDPDTTIEVTVDKYEILIACAGFVDSMFYQFPNLSGNDYYTAVDRYLRAALSGDYHKEVYLDNKGEIKVAKLVWNSNLFKELIHATLWDYTKYKLFKDLRVYRVFKYSSFLSIVFSFG